MSERATVSRAAVGMGDACFTCLVPAYNEADRIAAVLAAVVGHPMLSEVIVIDDGSSDGTGAVARKCGAQVIRTAGNLGKTGALLRGLAEVSTSHVVLIDADLSGLSRQAVSALIRPVLLGRAGAAISLRGNAPRTWRMIGIDYISGERAIPRAVLAGHEAELRALPRFGFEVFLNQLLVTQGARIAVVRWPGVASPSKRIKRGIGAGIWADVRMIADIFRAVGPVDCLRQIRALIRLRLPN